MSDVPRLTEVFRLVEGTVEDEAAQVPDVQLVKGMIHHAQNEDMDTYGDPADPANYEYMPQEGPLAEDLVAGPGGVIIHRKGPRGAWEWADEFDDAQRIYDLAENRFGELGLEIPWPSRGGSDRLDGFEEL